MSAEEDEKSNSNLISDPISLQTKFNAPFKFYTCDFLSLFDND